MGATGLPDGLLDTEWVHSHEEDTPAHQVFRPRQFPFPPARGRQSFRLRAGGVLIEGGPGLTDKPEESAGRWKRSDDGHIEFRAPGAAAPHRRFKILSIAKDRMVVSTAD